MPITWRKTMAIDGSKIDEDHRHLIEIINQFEIDAADGAGTETVTDTLNALRYYAKMHFRREEALQKLVQYPYGDAHHHEHTDLIKSLQKTIDAANSEAEDAAKRSVQQTANLLRSWLLDHILQSDVRMRPFVEAMQTHAARLKNIKDCADHDDIWQLADG